MKPLPGHAGSGAGEAIAPKRWVSKYEPNEVPELISRVENFWPSIGQTNDCSVNLIAAADSGNNAMTSKARTVGMERRMTAPCRDGAHILPEHAAPVCARPTRGAHGRP